MIIFLVQVREFVCCISLQLFVVKFYGISTTASIFLLPLFVERVLGLKQMDEKEKHVSKTVNE